VVASDTTSTGRAGRLPLTRNPRYAQLPTSPRLRGEVPARHRLPRLVEPESQPYISHGFSNCV